MIRINLNLLLNLPQNLNRRQKLKSVERINALKEV